MATKNEEKRQAEIKKYQQYMGTSRPQVSGRTPARRSVNARTDQHRRHSLYRSPPPRSAATIAKKLDASREIVHRRQKVLVVCSKSRAASEESTTNID